MTQNEFQRAAGISAGLAARWYPHLISTFAEFSIENPAAQAMFIAQVGHYPHGREPELHATGIAFNLWETHHCLSG